MIGITSLTDQDPAADKLLSLLADLDRPFAFERSFRICRETLLTDRFLLTTAKQSLGEDAHQTVTGLCHKLGLPAVLFETLGFHLPAAKFLHFGFEQGQHQCLYKIYFEFAKNAERTDPLSPELLHLAFKWDVSGVGQSAVTRYVRYPTQSPEDVLARLSQIYPGENVEKSFGIAKDVVLLAASRISANDLQYLEVREDGTDRRSFDLNLYDADLALKDLHPLLLRMGRQYGVAADRFDAFYGPIQAARAGHVAGGVHRDGEGFFNVYYGAGQWQGPSQAERDAARS